jgi:hypothetical protein
VAPALRSRIALVALLGAFLIPIGMSSLRGLTHVLTCADKTEIPFTLITPAGGDPVIVSSTTISRSSAANAGKVCGGLSLDVRAGPAAGGRVTLRLPISNDTSFDWKGTVKLQLGSTVVPVDVGEIRAGQTRTGTVKFKPPKGQLEVNGSLLIGP